MVYAKFTPALTNVTSNRVTQWDYGRTLRIEGLKLPTAVRIDFGVSGSQTTISRIGTTKDGVTDVVIPDSLLEQSQNLVAYVYVNDTTEGKTVRTINIPVTARAKPEEFDSPESKELFAEAIEMVNEAVARAESAEDAAKTHADSAKESLDSTQGIAESFGETATQAVKDVNNAGSSQIQAINNTKAEALETVQAEGSGQVKAIQDEGATQLGQIQEAGENIVEAAGIAEQNAKNVLANAIKGHLKGEVVTADDVSSVEHEMNVVVRSKNLLDVSKMRPTGGSTKISVTEVGANYIVITSESGYNSNGFCATGLTLSQCCPELREGDIVTLTAESNSTMKCFYLDTVEIADSGTKFWNFGSERVITKEMLNAIVCLYGFNAIADNEIGACTISNIQIEEGNTATDYTPYIDPATVNVSAGGKTYIPAADGTVKGISSTVLADGISTDTEGVVIDCEYIVDTKTYIDKKFEELKSLLQ